MTPKAKKTASASTNTKTKKVATKKPDAKPFPAVESEAAIATESTSEAAPKAPPKPAAEKKIGAIDAAAKLLAETGQPMTCREMIEAMAAKGYWASPGGKTPQLRLIARSCGRSPPRAPRPGLKRPNAGSLLWCRKSITKILLNPGSGRGFLVAVLTASSVPQASA